MVAGARVIDIARRTALRMNTTSKDLKLDLAMLLPPPILLRAGLPVDEHNIAWTVTPAAKDPWRSRVQPTVVVNNQKIDADRLAKEIIDAGARVRGEIPPEKRVGGGHEPKLVSSDTWLKQ